MREKKVDRMATPSLVHADGSSCVFGGGAVGTLDIRLTMRNGISILGSFDGVHRGHRRLIELAKERAIDAGCSVVAMSAEPHPVSFFRRGSTNFRLTLAREKLELLARYGVDFVYSPTFDAAFAGMSPREFVDSILVGALDTRHIVVGDDFHFGAHRSGTVEVLEALAAEHAIGVTVVPEVLVDGMRCSSSNIRSFIKAGELHRATRMLGHHWSFGAEATRQSSLTWLLRPSEELVEPAPGVYAVNFEVHGSHGKGLLVVSRGMILETSEALSGPQKAMLSLELRERKA